MTITMIQAIIQFTLWLFLIPMAVGSIFRKVDRQPRPLVFWWISGQMLLWAVFQLLCVPMVLLEERFHSVVISYAGVTGLLLLAAGGMALLGRRNRLRLAGEPWRTLPKKELLLWGIFAALLLFQLFQAVFLAYADGDDAYYVVISSITQDADQMYQKLPYTGYTTELDARHGMAPFPIWISFLSQISGVPAVVTAHVVVSAVLIGMTYGIFYLLGRHLFGSKREQLPLFLIFTELLVLFGDSSFQTAENFMIARSRQGKAALGNIIIPMLLYLLFLLLEKLQEQKKLAFGYWVLLLSVMTSACLCSTMGALLATLMVAVVGICLGVCYRRIKPVLAMALTCLPCVGYALLYLLY